MAAVPKHQFRSASDPVARARSWCEGLSPVFEVRLTAGPELPSWVGITSYNLGQILVGSISAPPQRLERPAPMISRQGIDHVLLQVYTAGEGRIEVGRRESVVKTGQMVVLDLSQPVVSEAGAVAATNIMIPRKLLGDHIATIEDLHGRAVDVGSDPAARIFHTYLTGLVACAEFAEPGQALQLSQVAVDLCGACFAPGETAVRAGGQLTGLAVRQFIEEELGNADFGVETILSRFDLSRTTLYRLFEIDGGAANYIRERRLLRALRLLTQLGARPRISAVAYSSGFSDEKTFSRAFRRRFGFLPREAGMADAAPTASNKDEPVLMSWMKTLTA